MPIRFPRVTDDPSSEMDILELAKDVLALEMGEDAKRSFRVRHPIQSGGHGTIVLELALDRDLPARTIRLAASDLLSPGSRIASDSVRVAPSRFTLPAGGSIDITVTVQAPPDARPGLYAGTVSATGDEIFVIPFQVEVR